MRLRAPRVAVAVIAGSLGMLAAANVPIAQAAPGGQSHGGPRTPSDSFVVTDIFNGASHTVTGATPGLEPAPVSRPLSNPDDITALGNDLFVGFQNGVGPQGQASTGGNLDSTIVELSLTGTFINQWNVAGKIDGMTADPAEDELIVTVNEDLNSAMYTLLPFAPLPTPTKYAFNEALPHGGGTDAISVYKGQILVSASAPGTTGSPAPQSTYPAVYSVQLNPGTHIATVTPYFYDEDTATVANRSHVVHGTPLQLALTDPDSNEVVPVDAPEFAGDFMLTSQGDLEQIFVGPGGPSQGLQVLSLTQAVDDTAWTSDSEGTLFATDSLDDTVVAVTGPFGNERPMVVATPCGSNSAPATCPAPPSFPANYLATLDPSTGEVSPVATTGAPFTPQGGLVFVAGDDD